MALLPIPRFPTTMRFAPERTLLLASDSTKYPSSPRSISRSADGAPKSIAAEVGS
jgi:hypothetical protein